MARGKHRQELLTKALLVLRRHKREAVAIGIPAIHGGLARPPYAIALVWGPYPEYHVVQVDTKGLTECSTGEDLLHMLGHFVTYLYAGDPDEFDVIQK
jgi:hypothetical protein